MSKKIYYLLGLGLALIVAAFLFLKFETPEPVKEDLKEDIPADPLKKEKDPLSNELIITSQHDDQT